MLHLLSILSFSTIISIFAYMVQHGEIEESKNFSKVNDQITKMSNQSTALTATSINYLRTN